MALFDFQKAHSRLPLNAEEDFQWCWNHAQKINTDNKTTDGITVEELDEKVVRNTVLYSTASICPMSAFFGGVIA